MNSTTQPIDIRHLPLIEQVRCFGANQEVAIENETYVISSLYPDSPGSGARAILTYDKKQPFPVHFLTEQGAAFSCGRNFVTMVLGYSWGRVGNETTRAFGNYDEPGLRTDSLVVGKISAEMSPERLEVLRQLAD